MSSHKYDRNIIKNSLMRNANREIGICETIREVYDYVYNLPDSELKTNITEKLIDALTMAKKMGDRLTYYYKLTNDTTGNIGGNLKQIDKKEFHRTLRRRRKRICK